MSVSDEKLIEAMELAIGYSMASLVSSNNMPDMSGDPRKRMPPHLRKRFDQRVRVAAEEALAAYRRHQVEAGIVEVQWERDYGIADAYVRGYVWSMENWPATLTQAKKAAADYEDKWQNGVIPNTLKQAAAQEREG